MALLLASVVALVPTAKADDCTQSGAGVGSISAEDSDTRWIAEGSWNCGTGLSPSMHGTYQLCELDEECDDSPTGSFSLDVDENECSWGLSGQEAFGDSVELHSSDGAPASATGKCGGEHDAFLTEHGACFAGQELQLPGGDSALCETVTIPEG